LNILGRPGSSLAARGVPGTASRYQLFKIFLFMFFGVLNSLKLKSSKKGDKEINDRLYPGFINECE
jgi:hypothetical protein